MSERLKKGLRFTLGLNSLSKIRPSQPHGLGGLFIGFVVASDAGVSRRSTGADAGLVLEDAGVDFLLTTRVSSVF